MTRTFEARSAVRESVPLLVGLMGPSGSGKTFSALRLATGIQQVTGGSVYGIDTEARRMLHYSDQFKFKHVQFDPPFGSLDYLEALEFCLRQGAKVIVVDSMSHEHSGPGGMIDFQEQELDRLAGNDWAKRERVKMLAWQKPKAARRRLIDRMLQMNANFVFCFRAKETVKPVKVGGKTEIVPQGFMPIAGDEFLFEQTVNCLLLPNARGVPTWESENVGEKLMMKLPKQFEAIFSDRRPLDEEIGRRLAEWAKGGGPATAPAASSSSTSPRVDGGAASSLPDETWDEYAERWTVMLEDADSADQLATLWNSDNHKARRRKIAASDEQLKSLMGKVQARIAALRETETVG